MNNKNYKVLGLMSGTSLDGLDLAYCYFFKKNNNWKFKLICCDFIEYSKNWKKKLLKLFYEIENLDKIELEYSNFIAKKINDFIKKNNLKVDYISSHGHTIFHNPNKGVTKQIGRGDIIFQKTKIPVICNFREQDVLLGGQGAPLVPCGDFILFNSYDSCLNLGGFSNISFRKNNRKVAYDICPINIILNFLAEKKGLLYDQDGLNATKGIINELLLNKLNDIDYYKLDFPKSLSKEWLENQFLIIINQYNIPTDDLLRTCVEHFSLQISFVFKKYKIKNCLVTGGGVFNKFLINRIMINSKTKLIFPEKKIILFKEAIIFAFLGLLRIKQETNCLSEITGASKNHSSGDIYF